MPELECIGNGKAGKPCEFGVKVSVAVTHKQDLGRPEIAIEVKRSMARSPEKRVCPGL